MAKKRKCIGETFNAGGIEYYRCMFGTVVKFPKRGEELPYGKFCPACKREFFAIDCGELEVHVKRFVIIPGMKAETDLPE